MPALFAPTILTNLQDVPSQRLTAKPVSLLELSTHATWIEEADSRATTIMLGATGAVGIGVGVGVGFGVGVGVGVGAGGGLMQEI